MACNQWRLASFATHRLLGSSAINEFVSGTEVTSSLQLLPEAVSACLHDPARREVLSALVPLGNETDVDLNRLVRMAASSLDVPMAAVSLVGTERQRMKAAIGIDPAHFDIAVGNGFCAHTIASDGGVLAIADALADPRFSRLSLVTSAPSVRAYLGVAIVVGGQRVAVLGVFSPEARRGFDDDAVANLTLLAETAGSLLQLKMEARAQARTAAALIQEEWRHALTLEAGKVGSWVWDVRSGEMVINDIMRRMLGFEHNRPASIEELFARVHVADVDRMRTDLNESLMRGGDYEGEYRLASSDRWQMSRGRVYQRDGDGRPLVMMGINFDVTETKHAADNTRLLLRELNHRVKNTLAMIQSLARQTVKTYPDPAAFIDAFSGRLRSLSDAHAILANRDWSGIRFMELIDGQVLPRLGDDKQMVLSGHDLDLPADHALGLALILNELLSNALRHGALSRPNGRVLLSWTESHLPQRRLDIVWREEGGPVVAAPRELGFGGRLIERSLAKIIDSAVVLSFPPGGVIARLSLPLPVGGE